MLNILLVEDSKFFGKLVKREINEQLGFSVTWVESYSEAKALLAIDNKAFFIGLVDLNLPDAVSGKIVDLMVLNNIPAVVFTGEINNEIREEIWSKKIIDYVIKQNIQDIKYIISLVRRIYLNQSVKILVVDDSKTYRKYLCQLLNIHKYKLVEASDGYDALIKLEQNPDIRMVITDYHMPNIDGFELTKRIRSKYSKDELAVIGLSSRANHLLAAQFIKNGANDFIMKPFISEEFYSRVTQNIEIIEQINKRLQAEKELILAKEEALEANQYKSEFLANMSHEIRTPMNAILGLTHLTLQTRLSRKQKDYLDKIQSSAQSLLGIINDILDFSKIEAGKLEIETVEFQLDDVLENVGNLVALKAEQKGLEVSFMTSRDVPLSLLGDPFRLGQVLTNLTDNAVKFTEKGEIVVKTEIISESAIQNPDIVSLQFSVQDTGIGLSKQQIEGLFKSFSQANGSTTRKYGGTGLGLTICKRLVEMMNGDITVDSEPGAGSTFTFTAQFIRQSTEKERRLISPVDLRGIRVLVVDDNSTARRVLADMLESFSFMVEQVASGNKAIKKVEEAADSDPYDLVIMDWKMPLMDGLEASKIIKQSRCLTQIPAILLMTGYQNETAFNKTDRTFIDACITKPINQSVLFDTIMGIFGQVITSKSDSPLKTIQETRTAEPIDGAKILLVEDNEINRQVAKELMENAGLQVVTAVNGKEAVEVVMKLKDASSFDAVLMDIQMPEMDGYEATKTIRRDSRFDALPIIAMTAHAMKGEREKCLEAGMNDHLTKPIDPELFFATLSEWIRDKQLEKITDQSSNLTQEVEDGLPEDLAGFDVKTGLTRVGGNVDFYKKLLKEFVEEFGQVAEEMRDILLKGDIQSGKRLVHTIKGVAGNLAATELYEITKEFEAAFKQSDKDNFLSLMNRFDTSLNQVVASVKRFGSNKPIQDQKILSEHGSELTESAALCRELKLLLDSNDLINEGIIIALKNSLRNISNRKLLDVITNSIIQFDYERAKLSLAELTDSLGISM